MYTAIVTLSTLRWCTLKCVSTLGVVSIGADQFGESPRRLRDESSLAFGGLSKESGYEIGGCFTTRTGGCSKHKEVGAGLSKLLTLRSVLQVRSLAWLCPSSQKWCRGLGERNEHSYTEEIESDLGRTIW